MICEKNRGVEMDRGVKSLSKLLGESNSFVLAPMVEYGQLPFRLLVRRYGIKVCYSPMWHSRLFLTDKSYRQIALITSPDDDPLVFQFCANDPDLFLECARVVNDRCVGVDLNLGCPQNIAKRGHYGAFLQNEWNLISEIISRASTADDLGEISAKIRVFDTVQKSVQYAQMIEKAGAKVLAVHGRTIDQKGQATGIADWNQIRRIKIPVIANGNIRFYSDGIDCLRETGCDAIMVAEGALDNPAIANGQKEVPVCSIAEQFLEIVEQNPVPKLDVRGYLHKLFAGVFNRFPELRQSLNQASTLTQYKTFVIDVRTQIDDVTSNELTEFGIPFWLCQPRIRSHCVI